MPYASSNLAAIGRSIRAGPHPISRTLPFSFGIPRTEERISLASLSPDFAKTSSLSEDPWDYIVPRILPRPFVQFLSHPLPQFLHVGKLSAPPVLSLVFFSLCCRH